MKQFQISAFLAAILIVALMLSVGGERQMATAAPAAQITPVAATAPLTGAVGNTVSLFAGEPLTASTRRCADLSAYRVADIQYVIDHGTVNTTTLQLQHTINNVDFSNGQVLVSNSAADGDALNRYDLYGRHTCVNATLTNANPITVTVLVLPRQ